MIYAIYTEEGAMFIEIYFLNNILDETDFFIQ